MRIKISTGAPAGRIEAPPSKSYGHRMLICAALAAYCAGKRDGEVQGDKSHDDKTHGGEPRDGKSADQCMHGSGTDIAGTSVIYGIGEDGAVSEDILATVDCIRALGIGCTISEGRAVVGGYAPQGQTDGEATQSGADMRASGADKEPYADKAPYADSEMNASSDDPGDHGLPVLPCRESGSTLRFFIPIAMVLAGGGIFICSDRLMDRGIEVYEELFAQNQQNRCQTPLQKIKKCNELLMVPDTAADTAGVGIARESGRIVVEGGLMPGEMTVRGDVSSQFITGLLLALPLLEGDSTLHVSQPIESRRYIDITIDVMRSYGVTVSEPVPGTFHISGGQRYKAKNMTVEGDWSSAAFLYAMRFLHKEMQEGRLYTGTDAAENTCTGDKPQRPLEICGLDPDSMQGDRICIGYFHELDTAAIRAIDISDCPDLGPILFAYAAARNGGCFTGVERLRIKESDRIACMQEELAKFGIEAHSSKNGLVVYPGRLRAPAEVLCGHNDHRIVMALAVLCTLTGGVIDDAQAVSKSWPGFWQALEKLGIRIEVLSE